MLHVNGGQMSLADLVGNHEFEIIEDSSEWNQDKTFMVDIIGGMTPDIVIRGKQSGENRIYIEVKNGASLNYGKEDSQIIRYFLHLLASSHKSPGDIARAIVLAAPRRWFNSERNAEAWQYFVDHFGDLAKCFDVRLAILYLDEVFGLE